MKDETKKKKMSQLEEPQFFYISLSQHIGNPAAEIVKTGDYVKRFQLIGESQGNISAKIHSPVSGNVKDIIEKAMPNGANVKTVIIENDFQYIFCPHFHL